MAEGERRIPIETPSGSFEVWTRQVGRHPTRKLLLLHGGPGATHEGFEVFDEYLSPLGIEFYYYDQLGSYRSDQPDEPTLWQIERFVDEASRELGLALLVTLLRRPLIVPENRRPEHLASLVE